jgi:TonB-linked SusC/RagA family outer membrane protein
MKQKGHLKGMLLLLCLLACGSLTFAQRTITGTVTDAETGEALIGVRVIVSGTSLGAMTDIDGKYSLDVPEENDVLEFSYSGYQANQITLGTSRVYDITLTSNTQLDEVVIVGYGTAKKEDLTGAIGSVRGASLEARGSADALEALQGQLPGVNITRSSGRSDVSFDLVIRGQNSISGGSPLYVVDGLVVENIEFLNPNDIAQIDILKDASSTAVFGSRGSNGVVIIKTKGMNTAGEKISISYDGYYGVRTPAHLPPMMNAEEWLNYRIAASQGNNTEPFSGDVFGPTTEVVPVSGEQWDREIQRRIQAGETYNWPEQFMENGLRQNHYLALQGISGQTSFGMTAGYQKEKGFFEKDFMNKYTFSLSLSHKFSDQWEVGGQFRTGFKETEVAGEKSILNFYRMPPIALASDPTGWLWEDEGLTIRPSRMTTGAVNPLLDQKYSNTNGKSLDLLGNLFLKFEPTDWLTLRTDFLPRFSTIRTGEWRGLYSSNAGGTQEKNKCFFKKRKSLEFHLG